MERREAGRLSQEEQAAEWTRCEASPIYFLRRYGWVFNVNEEAWVPFELWDAQAWVLLQMMDHRFVVLLKARQLGLTWLVLGFALWLMLFHASAAIGIFSRIETDAQELLFFRLRNMYDRLPAWMQAERIVVDNKSRWELSNGSMALAFPTTGGRQYTFSLVVVDEADHQPDLDSLMVAAKPTIDAGARMVLISSVDKDKPGSRFKNMYRAAKLGLNEWHNIFLPWWARPERTAAWYAAQKRDALANTGALDDLHQEYPETDTEALAPRELGKRIPGRQIEACYSEIEPLGDVVGAPALPGLEVYRMPEAGRRYVIGADPAEGNPNSDDSAATVLDELTGEECAALAGKFEPGVFGAHIKELSGWYNRAPAMVERNNHGHAVLLWLRDNSRVPLLLGLDNKPGWNDNSLGKATLYTALAEAFRDVDTVLHSFASYAQIASIEGATLKAPEGARDDRADAYALANVARGRRPAERQTARVKVGRRVR